MNRVAITLAMLVASSSPVYATLAVSSALGGAPRGSVKANFDDLSLGAGDGQVAAGLKIGFGGDAQAVRGTVFHRYAAPVLSGANGTGFGTPDQAIGRDMTTYITSGSTASDPASAVTFSFAAQQAYFGLLWGSVDAYNALEFFSGSTLVGRLTGSQVSANPPGDAGPDGSLYVNIGSTTPFDRVVATSTNYAFEIDNVAFGPSATTAVPEPASLALAGMGLLAVVAGRSRLKGRRSV